MKSIIAKFVESHLVVGAVIFTLFTLLNFWVPSTAEASYLYSGPSDRDECPEEFCPALIFTTCWNSWAVEETDCGTACDGGDTWMKYEYVKCVYLDSSCNREFQRIANTCSTGDKYNSGNPPVMDAGRCDCSVGGGYKTCCSGGSPVNAIPYQVDPYAPDEAYCPGGSSTNFCSFDGYPACGPAACAPVVTPTPTPTPLPQCQCQYSQACDSDGNGSFDGTQTCNGVWSGGVCVWDSSGVCNPACGSCTGAAVPTTPPPSGCSFSACGASGCQPDQRYVSGTCSYSWYSGPGCYYDTSCGGDDDYVPPTTGPNCYSGDTMYFEPSDPGQGELLTVVVLSKGPGRYLSIALDITYPSNPAGVQVRTSPSYPAIPPEYQAQGYIYSWGWLIGPAQIGTTPYLFEFSVNGRSQYCVSKSLFIEQLPTCTVDLVPSSMNIQQGQTPTLVASTQVTNGTVSRVDFSSSNTAIATVNPASDNSSPYSTTVSTPGVGSATLTGNVYLNPGGVLGCTDTTPITITPPSPWFQTQGGDVHGQGNIYSPLPWTLTSNKYFSLELDGYPGVVSYIYDFPPSFGSGTASSRGWLANSSFAPGKSTYDYFWKKLDRPETDNFSCDSACPTPPSSQTTIYYSLNSVTIDGNNSWAIPANTKVVVLVNGDLNISLNLNRRITVPVGSFLAFFVKGNINIGGNVGNKDASAANPHLQGMYIADEVIDTYEPDPAGLGSGFRLVSGGLFYGKTNVELERDVKSDCAGICNATTPSELFIFRPDLVLNAPHELWYSKMSWLEVAP